MQPYCDACGYTREETIHEEAAFLGIPPESAICCGMPDAAPPDVHTASQMAHEGKWWEDEAKCRRLSE